MSGIWYSNTEEYPTTGMEIKFGNPIEELKKQILELSQRITLLQDRNQELEGRVQDLEDYVEYDGEDEAIDEREDSNYRECDTHIVDGVTSPVALITDTGLLGISPNGYKPCMVPNKSVVWNETPYSCPYGSTLTEPGQGVEADLYPEVAENLRKHNLAWKIGEEHSQYWRKRNKAGYQITNCTIGRAEVAAEKLGMLEDPELLVSAPSDSYKLQEQITKVFTPLVEAVFRKESIECDCGAEKHGFLSHITGCPAGSK